MTPFAQKAIEDLLEDGGFIQDGKRSSGLIDAEIASKSMNTDLRYHRLLLGSIETESVDLVYEIPSQVKDVPGTPSIYFKFFDYQPSKDTIIKLRTSVWNQGRVPTLWIITPDAIRIYNSFARPQLNETEDSHLLAALTRIGEGFNCLKEVEAFHKNSFDSGAFWQSIYGQRIDRSQRVDQSMLADLSKTVEILTTPELIAPIPALDASTAHALLGRAIFVSYLQDRLILDETFFEGTYHCPSFTELLDSKSATYSFFKWLRDTFNGNLFPLGSNEEEIVDPCHLYIVKQFLLGTDLHSYPVERPRLWPYRFNIIPIELISSIYEMFAHSLDPKAAEAGSVHYTRLHVVELLLSLAMQGVTHTARVLDPACGSGVFLVEAFRRLAWLRSKEYGRLLRRDELHELLCTQIFGIDIDLDAVNVAAFSLYLTLLELDPDPQPPAALKFPYLLLTPSSEDHVPNLYVQDFLNTDHIFNQKRPFADREFDIIIGNPPWTALKKDTAVRDPDDPIKGRQWGLEYCIKNQIPDKKPDQAFLMRAHDFAGPYTKIFFIVCSRIFYQQEDRSWLETFLDTSIVETVINFSDLVGENILFGGEASTRLPASALLYRVGTPTNNNKIVYIVPKWYPGVNKRDEIVITSDDIHSLSQRLVRQKPFLWKSAFRGVARDYRLLSRLQNLPSVESVLLEAGIKELAHRGLIFGKGEQGDASILQGKPFLASGLSTRYSIDVTTLSLFNRPTIAKRRKPRFLELPALIISRSLYKGRASIALVEDTGNRKELVIDQMYYGIPSSATYPGLVYRLNAIFNSKIALYMAFMFSSGLGWDRRLIEVGDWLQVRLPRTILDEGNSWTKVLRLEQQLREIWLSEPNSSLDYENSKVEAMLDQEVFDLYELSEQEIILVEDTLRYNLNSLIYRKQRRREAFEAFSEPSPGELTAYAERVRLQLDSILRYNNLRIVPTVFTFKEASPLSICQFTQKKSIESAVINTVHLSGLEKALSLLSSDLRTAIADHLSLHRNLRIYDGQSFWVIKPSQKHLWSETAALSDADAVVSEHMEASRIG